MSSLLLKMEKFFYLKMNVGTSGAQSEAIGILFRFNAADVESLESGSTFERFHHNHHLFFWFSNVLPNVRSFLLPD